MASSSQPWFVPLTVRERAAGIAASKAAAKATLGSAVALILGAMAAALGGALAGRRYVVRVVDDVTPPRHD